MARTPTRVAIVAGHPVILGIVRLACDARVDLIVVSEAFRGDGVLDAPAQIGADVLILDLELPDMDGLEVLRRVRGEGFTGSIVVLSDRTDGATVLDVLRAGADAYLTKAEGLRHVAATIRAVADGERVVEPALEEAAVRELGRFARQTREGAELVDTLTVREREILGFLADGLTMQQIGRRLAISPRTVETHVSKLYRKLGVRSRVQAVSRAAALGLIEFR